jgi:hypothetical protein
VLFIPGNAGSSKQVRSIASSAAHQYFESRTNKDDPRFRTRPGVPKVGEWEELDFYTGAFEIDHSRVLLQGAATIDLIAVIMRQSTSTKNSLPSIHRRFKIKHITSPIPSGTSSPDTPLPEVSFSSGTAWVES